MAKLSELDLRLPSGIDLGTGEVLDANALSRKSLSFSFQALNHDQQKALTAARIQAKPDYTVYSIGGGVIDKERALAELTAETALGRLLMEFEARQISVVQRVLAQQDLEKTALELMKDIKLENGQATSEAKKFEGGAL